MGFITWHTYLQIGHMNVFLGNVLQTQTYDLDTDIHG